MTDSDSLANGVQATPPELPVRTMDEILSDLGKRAAPRAFVDIPEWGTRMEVRGLTRAEALNVQSVATGRGTRPADPAVQEREYLVAGTVNPHITAAHYAQLRHRADVHAVLNRIEAKITELTTGEPLRDPNGEEVAPLDAAYFPAGGAMASETAARATG